MTELSFPIKLLQTHGTDACLTHYHMALQLCTYNSVRKNCNYEMQCVIHLDILNYKLIGVSVAYVFFTARFHFGSDKWFYVHNGIISHRY